MLLSTALAVPWTVDATSFDAAATKSSAVPCASDNGEPTTLAVALVVYSRKQITMAWGHSSLRIVRCVAGEVVDQEYETYRLGRWNESLLVEAHAGEDFASDPAYLRTQRGSLVLFRNDDPVDAGWYRDAQGSNREIYELWLDLPPDALRAVAARAEDWYDTQLHTLRSREALGSAYVPWTRNCTTVLKQILPAGVHVDSALPFAWLRAHEAQAAGRVLHPSSHLWQRWRGQPPDTTHRLHPILRRRARSITTAAPPRSTASG